MSTIANWSAATRRKGPLTIGISVFGEVPAGEACCAAARGRATTSM